MIRYSYPFLLVAFICLTVPSCVKESPDFVYLNTKATFRTQHHERAVPNIKVYIKYGASEFPGYDDFSIFDTVVVSNEFAEAVFPEVPLGKNWVVAVGIDEVLQEPVIGNLPFEITNISMPWDTTLYVSED